MRAQVAAMMCGVGLAASAVPAGGTPRDTGQDTAPSQSRLANGGHRPLTVAARPRAESQDKTRADPQDDAPSTDAPLTDEQRIRVVLRGGAKFHFDADLDDGGDVAVSRVQAGADFVLALTDRVELTLAPDAEFSFYDFGGLNSLAAEEIIEDAYRQRYEARVLIRANDRWSILTGGNLTWAAEFDADTSDSMTGGGFVSANYAVSPKLILGAGVAVQSRLEESAWVFPFPFVEWRFAERWQLTARGVGGQLSYTPSEAWTIFARGGWEPREFRLRDDGPVPEGILRDERIVIDFGASYRPGAHVELTATLGLTPWNEYEVQDSGGSTLREDEAETHLNAGAGVTLRF